MANPIVVVNVSQTQAPIPSNLQKTGAVISMGGTVLTAGSYSLLSQAADLTALLTAPLAITSVNYSGGRVTVTTTAPHGVTNNTMFVTEISGFVPEEYNGTYFAWATGASTFQYLGPSSNPGAATTVGTYTPPTVAELQAMVDTFFTQNPGLQAVSVLELGAVSTSTAISNLSAFILASEQIFYSYLVPRSWADDEDFLTLAGTYSAASAKTYFFTTVNEQNKDAVVASGYKSIMALIESPSYPSGLTQSISNASWSGGVVTFTVSSSPGLVVGNTYTITGVSPTGYNGTYVATPGTVTTTLKALLADDPGSYVSGGSVLGHPYGGSDGIPATEFSHAADFFTTLNYDPSPTNRVTPLAFSYMYGVTAFPTVGNKSLITTLGTEEINYVGFGSEGGISDRILFNGHTLDGRPFNYWYSVDWIQINAKLALANATINGSNNPINPLYYDQTGIDRLQDVLVRTCGSGIAFGLILGRTIQTELDATTFQTNLNRGLYAGNCVVNAIPFVPYTRANPSHYRQGIYNGLSITFTPLRGFERITVNINVTDFVS
jgi:hypothetical protein